MFKPTKKQHVVNKNYADKNGGSGGNVPTLYISGDQYADLTIHAEIVSGNVNDFLESLYDKRLFDVHINVQFYGDTHGIEILHVTEVIVSGSIGDDIIIKAYRIVSESSAGPEILPYEIIVDMDGNVTIQE